MVEINGSFIRGGIGLKDNPIMNIDCYEGRAYATEMIEIN